jgi:flagellar biosynthesis GTPase FlhF
VGKLQSIDRSVMSHLPRFRWILAPVLAGLLTMVAGIGSPAWASTGYGQASRFKGVNEGAKKNREFELAGEEANAFGVDTAEKNQVYIGDENGEEQSGELRIQRFSAAGAFEATATLTEGTLKKGVPSTGLNPNPIAGFEGIAVDPGLDRIYALAVYKRFYEDGVDPSAEDAGAVYAFSTNASGTELVPATGTGIDKNGLLGSATALNSGSETQGQALLNPTGIAVNPKTHEVLILGEVDEGAGVGGGEHPSIDRLSDEGALLNTYVDPTAVPTNEEPNSPVVSAGGRIFIVAGDEIQELPSVESTAAPKSIYTLSTPALSPFHEEVLAFGENNAGGLGAALTIVPDAAPHTSEGRLVVDAEVNAVGPEGVLISGEANPGALLLNYHEEEGKATKVAESGWTGGVKGAGEEESASPCQIGFAVGYPLIAAGSEERLFVLTPTFSEVIDFAPGGSGCPSAKVAASGLEAKVNGSKTTSVTTTSKVLLVADVVQANVVSVTWNFGNGEEETVETPTEGEVEHPQRQAAEVEHKFPTPGKVKVKATIHTDDLETPTLTAELELTNVEGEEPISIKKEPANQSVVEGSTASFEASAAGSPKPTVQWEVKEHGSGTWSPVSGATSNKLEVTGTTISESGNEYRAAFTSGKEKADSTAATLTVESQAAHKQKEEEARKKKEEEEAIAKKKAAEKRAEEEAAATRKAEEEAAAKKKGEEEAAAKKKAEEEAAKKEGPPAAKIASTSLSVSASGAVTIKVSCPTGTTCTGTVTLKTLTAVSARLASAAKKKKSILTLATGSFSITGGQTKSITLHLSSAARTLLSRSHVLQARATVVAHDPSGGSNTAVQTVTLRLAKAKHH